MRTGIWIAACVLGNDVLLTVSDKLGGTNACGDAGHRSNSL